ncbi:hypothetical protein HN662_01350 [Candidatus Woesearchaeota archaeon]|nr:hypothetical protein [Candidatus Woesearchaeota archaeon]
MYFQQALNLIGPDLIEVILPFILVFAVVYAVSSQIPQMKEKPRMQMVLALVIALLVIIPHVTSNYYYGEVDVVQVINSSIPQVALLIIAVVIALMLIGALSTNSDDMSFHMRWIKWVALIVVALIFIDNIGIGSVSGYGLTSWFGDPEFQAIIIIVIIFGVLVKFITGSGIKDHKCKCGQPFPNRAALSHHIGEALSNGGNADEHKPA